MTHLAMIPIDEAARDGAPRLLAASDGTRHSAAWHGDHWAYTVGIRVHPQITHYCARLPGPRPEVS